MLLGLDNFDVDMFLTFEDKNIFIYYSDFESVPELVNYVPLGSFDDETESYLWVNLDYEVRLQVALLFMQRDMYAYRDPNTKQIMINRDMFMNEFGNIPEVTNFFDQYKNICKNYGVVNYPAPDSWIKWQAEWAVKWYYVVDGNNYIDWSVYPDWCQECPEHTYAPPEPGDPTPKCAGVIPTDVIPPTDLYFISVVYFNGIYRTNPESIQDFGVYDILTDIDFELNKYSLVVDIQKFFTNEFQWFLQTIPGMIPFGSDYGTHIKHAIQTKNTTIRQIEVQNEINFFIYNFNEIYGDLVQVKAIEIVSRESDTGGDTWLIEVDAVVKKERLVYRIEAIS